MAKEAMEAGHTPGPWSLHDRWLIGPSGPVAIASGYHDWVTAPGGSKYDEWLANAALIVTAVNSHEALVKALQDTERHLAFQHKWLSDQFDAMGRTRDEGTVGADTWEQIEATYALWKQVKSALASATPHTLIARKTVQP